MLQDKKKFKIISIDNYSTGSKKNHIKNKRVKYLKNNTVNIEKILKQKHKKIDSLFHFGEFARIYQSFQKYEDCTHSNLIGTKAVFNFCLKYKIKLIFQPLHKPEIQERIKTYLHTHLPNLKI